MHHCRSWRDPVHGATRTSRTIVNGPTESSDQHNNMSRNTKTVPRLQACSLVKSERETFAFALIHLRIMIEKSVFKAYQKRRHCLSPEHRPCATRDIPEQSTFLQFACSMAVSGTHCEFSFICARVDEVQTRSSATSPASPAFLSHRAKGDEAQRPPAVPRGSATHRVPRSGCPSGGALEQTENLRTDRKKCRPERTSCSGPCANVRLTRVVQGRKNN